jgi:hypothetical protein
MPMSSATDELAEGGAEDLLLPVPTANEISPDEIARASAPPRPGNSTKRRSRKNDAENGPGEEIGYRFPYGRVALEPIPDTSGAYGTQGTYSLRLAWHRGKAVLPVFESTPLRPIALVTLGGQRYPVFLNQHSRKRRERVILGGKRKTAKSPRCLLRFVTVVEGREDRFSWLWRIAATQAAVELAPKNNESGVEDEVCLHLPFAPGKARVIQQAGVTNAYALWMNDIVATVAVGEASGVKEGYLSEARLTYDERAFTLILHGADLGGKGVSLRLETWFAQARTEAEARAALLLHAADIADRLQKPPAPETFPRLSGFLNELVLSGESVLNDDARIEKRGADKLAYKTKIGSTTLHVAGEGVDAALACTALLARFYMTGNDALRRRARLLANGVCDFQISTEESPHWGAIWDAHIAKKTYGDVVGGTTVSVATTARAAKGLFVCNAHFDRELMLRTALSATQWLMLKTDRDGFIPVERFLEDGPPVDDSESPWMMAEALIPLVETFRANENEVFLKVAQRILGAIKEGVGSSTLRFEDASCELLAAAVEGILMVSREYESEDMIATAKQIMLGLRVRRQPDGSLTEPPGVAPVSPLVSTLAGARAALALTRVDADPQWLLFALRAVRAAGRQARELEEAGCPVNVADWTSLMMHSLGILLAIAQRAPGSEADRDKISIKKGWQTFAPDQATREFIQVTTPDGGKVDYLALVCPVSLQVLIAAVTPPDVTEIKIIKNGRAPFVKNLLDGDFDLRARLLPLGDGAEANIGIFLADT